MCQVRRHWLVLLCTIDVFTHLANATTSGTSASTTGNLIDVANECVIFPVTVFVLESGVRVTLRYNCWLVAPIAIHARLDLSTDCADADMAMSVATYAGAVSSTSYMCQPRVLKLYRICP